MRLVRDMIAISAGIFWAMTCTGCTAFVTEEYPVAANAPPEAVEMTHAMRVAVPAPIGAQSQSFTVKTLPPPVDGLRHAENVLLEYGVVLPSSYDALTAKAVPSARIDLAGTNADKVSLSFITGFNVSVLEQTGWSATPGLRTLYGQLGAQRLLVNGAFIPQRYGAEFAFAAPSQLTGLNFDIGVVPSASYSEEGDFSVRRVRAEFRFGQDIDQRGTNEGLPSWYFFAAADGEAVIFNNSAADRGLGLINGLQLRDQVTVGDIQAGLNIRRYGTTFSLNYVRREVEYELNGEPIQRNEDFGGISLSWRR